MIWAGITDGRTHLYVFARVTAVSYMDETLEPYVHLFTGAVGPRFILMDDNARHTELICSMNFWIFAEGISQINHQTSSLFNDENVDFIVLNNKLSTVKEIIKEISQLKCSYFNLPEETDLKDALDVTIDLQAEAQEVEIKLPDLPLPTFNGKIQEFEFFKTQFMNVIGNNHSLDNTQKLCYLKSALKNDASLIQSDQDTFESLMEALINRYENKRALVDIHITEMISVPKIQNENPVQLRLLTDTVSSPLRSLKNLRMDSNLLSDDILLHLLHSKIDRESQRLFQLYLKTTEVPSLQDLFSFLEIRCIQLESIRNRFRYKKLPSEL
ncbi:uncharacterized protein TNCV_2683851 [Trichonephila clavipes]|nr:uncharacterized protein TNCV_2683851 [Trichonephila clavipes]